MSDRARMVLFALGATAFAVVLVAALAGLPAFGHPQGPYARAVTHLAVPQRTGTDTVTDVNFDIRAIDTLGEEFILFAAVLGLAVLLRQMRGERVSRDPAEEHPFSGRSAALGALTLGLAGPLVLLGLYVVLHGHLTPGGGFQGGVVLAVALLVVFLGGEYLGMRVIAPHALVEFGEAAGAAAFGLIGLGGMLFGVAFFANFLPVGSAPGRLLSAGTIPLGNIAVGIEVAGAFVLLWSEFMDQALVVRARS